MTSQPVPLLGFAPDIDPSTPGVLVDCSNVVPTRNGLRALENPTGTTATGAVTAVGVPSGGKVVQLTNGTLTLMVASSGLGTSRLFGYQNLGGWHSAMATSSLFLGERQVQFAAFGSRILVAHKSVDGLLSYNYGSTATTIAGSPSAMSIVSSNGFALAFNVTASDGWYCSAILDETSWTLSLSTQCVQGRIIDVPGEFTCAVNFGQEVLAFKTNATYVGRYVGAPAVWQWTRIFNAGAVGPSAAAETPFGVFFIGRNGVFVYDGTSTPRSIADGVLWDWLLETIDYVYGTFDEVVYDAADQRVWFVSRTGRDGQTTGLIEFCLIYDIQSGRWGVSDHQGRELVFYPESGLSPTARDRMALLSTGVYVVKFFSGTAATSHFVTGDFGDDEFLSECSAVRVRYTDEPTSSTLTAIAKSAVGATLSTAATSSPLSDGKYDVRQTNRWHRFKVVNTGDWEASAIRPTLTKAGSR